MGICSDAFLGSDLSVVARGAALVLEQVEELTERVGPQEAELSWWSCALRGKAPADGAVKRCLRVSGQISYWINMIQVGRRWRCLGTWFCVVLVWRFFLCLFLLF